jgi:hypothetical protein
VITASKHVIATTIAAATTLIDKEIDDIVYLVSLLKFQFHTLFQLDCLPLKFIEI